MKKTYATSLPDHIGAFLKASRCFAALGINITRVSYDKAVDAHMLFLDVEGTPEQLRLADAALERIGYLQNTGEESSIVLLQFDLQDRPGAANEVLKLIHEFTSTSPTSTPRAAIRPCGRSGWASMWRTRAG